MPDGIDSWSRQKLLVLMVKKQAVANRTLALIDQRTLDSANWQLRHEEHTRIQDRKIAKIERRQLLHSGAPLLLTVLALCVALLSLLASAWTAGNLGIGTR